MLSKKEQYEHPHWQKKRLEIFNRDNWHCRCCDETNVALHVHHLYYNRDCHIWEIDNEGLVTVCVKCHKILHDELSKLSGIIAFNILCGKIDPTDFNISLK